MNTYQWASDHKSLSYWQNLEGPVQNAMVSGGTMNIRDNHNQNKHKKPSISNWSNLQYSRIYITQET